MSSSRDGEKGGGGRLPADLAREYGPLPYRGLNLELRRRFGEKVYKVALKGGFTCPNRDGTLGAEGCIFCSPADLEPPTYAPGKPVSVQLAEGIDYVRRRHGARLFIAYLQDYTATYGPLDRLDAVYRAAVAREEVVGLAVGTRPDCLPDAVIDLIARVARGRMVWVELGLPSANPETLRRIRRGHAPEAFADAARRCREAGVATAAHVVIGLPGEGPEDERATADYLARTGVEGVKIHNLYVSRGTELDRLYRRGEYRPLELEEYGRRAADFIERLPPRMVIHRVTGEGPRRSTVAPEWSINKLGVMNAVRGEIRRRGGYQGRLSPAR